MHSYPPHVLWQIPPFWQGGKPFKHSFISEKYGVKPYNGHLFMHLIKRGNFYGCLGACYHFFVYANRVFEIQKSRPNHSLRPIQYKNGAWVLQVVIDSEQG